MCVSTSLYVSVLLLVHNTIMDIRWQFLSTTIHCRLILLHNSNYPKLHVIIFCAFGASTSTLSIFPTHLSSFSWPRKNKKKKKKKKVEKEEEEKEEEEEEEEKEETEVVS